MPQISHKQHIYRWLLHLCGLIASQGFWDPRISICFSTHNIFLVGCSKGGWLANPPPPPRSTPGGVYLRSLFCAPGHHQRVTVKLRVDVHVNILKPICIGKGNEKWHLKCIKLSPLYSVTYRYHPRIWRDKILCCDMSCLIICTFDIKSEFHRTVWTKFITCAVLRGKEKQGRKGAEGYLLDSYMYAGLEI